MSTQKEKNKGIIGARNSTTEIIDILLEAGVKPSEVDNEGCTPLHTAARYGKTEVVYSLLKANAKHSIVDNEGLTPLHTAARYGKTEVVDILLKANAKHSVVDNEGWTPLHTAARYGKTEVVDTLLKANAKHSVVDNEGQTPLHKAAREGTKEVAILLLKARASPNEKDKEDQTPLHIAALYSHTGVIDRLLNANAKSCLLNKKGQAPLHIGVMYDKREVVKLLLKAKALPSVMNQKDETPLHIGVMYGFIEVVKLLLEAKASLNKVDKEGQTPLHNAAREGTKEVVILLLDAGASLNEKDKKCQTPLHIAVMYGFIEVVKLLLEKKTSLNEVDNEGQTPLHKAAKERSKEVVILLLDAGALRDIKDNEGRTCLHLLAMCNKTEEDDVVSNADAPLSEEDNNKQIEKVWTMDMLCNTDEIVDQFSMIETIDEMKELLLHGTFSSHEHCVFLGGVCNSGKSTLANILIGENILQHWKSTDGAKIYCGRYGIDLKNKTWVPLKKGSDGDVLTKVLRGKPDMKQEEPGATLSKNREIILHDSSKGCIVPRTVPQRTDITISISTAPAPSLVSGTGKDDVNITDSFRKQSLQNCTLATIQKDIKEEIRKGTYKTEIVPLDLVDFGGNRSFDMTHQLLMRNKGTFVLMFNGAIDVSKSLNEYEQIETAESNLIHWVNTILSYCTDDEDILPIIMFSATHSDHFNQEERICKKAALINDLTEIFRNHIRQHRIIYNDIFFIDGTNKNDPEINRLKNKLVEVAFKQNAWGKRIPMAWVPLDLQMSELRLHNMNIISKDELRTLNQRNEDLALTVEHIKYFLNFQHSLGKILYFDQQGLDHMILLQPISLVNISRSFITAEYFWPEDNELKGILYSLMNTGQITKQDLLKLWSQEKFHQDMPNDDVKEFIIQVMVHLDILVEPRYYGQVQGYKARSYFLPCAVKRRLPVTDFYVKSADKMICLCYTVLKLSISAAFSFKLIGAVMNVWPLKETPEGICLYHGAAVLCIDSSNELHLLVEDDKVFVYLINTVAKCSIPPSIAHTVQECLTFTMMKVLESYHTNFGKSLSTLEVSKAFKIEVGEWCKSGGNCYISVSKVQEKREWICKNNRTHQTTYLCYWLSNKKQCVCDARCSGPAETYLARQPKDKHLFRLAKLISLTECFTIINKLITLKKNIWEDMIVKYEYDMAVPKFFAFLEWTQLMCKNGSEPLLKDLSNVLEDVNDIHLLCRVLKEDSTVNAFESNALLESPSDDVLKEVANIVGPCAMHLGVELGLDMSTIHETLYKYPRDMLTQILDIMRKWKISSEDNTICMLMKAFQSADPRGFNFLRDKYSV